MDFEQNNNRTETTVPIPAAGIHKKRTGWRIFWGVILALSVLANIALFMMLIGVVAVFATGQSGILVEEVIQKGPRTKKIAVISVQGIINSGQAQDVYEQLKLARDDEWVKGLIIRVNSPGGTVSASDRIYNEIRKFREKTDKPVVAFMQGTAASGGYYVSVACETIVAEPTTITGSIGVIAGHFVLQELLENTMLKLGYKASAEQQRDSLSAWSPNSAGSHSFIVTPMTSHPAAARSAAATDESTPPDIATTTRAPANFCKSGLFIHQPRRVAVIKASASR